MRILCRRVRPLSPLGHGVPDRRSAKRRVDSIEPAILNERTCGRGILSRSQNVDFIEFCYALLVTVKGVELERTRRPWVLSCPRLDRRCRGRPTFQQLVDPETRTYVGLMSRNKALVRRINRNPDNTSVAALPVAVSVVAGVAPGETQPD